jgi:hypothetical protein
MERVKNIFSDWKKITIAKKNNRLNKYGIYTFVRPQIREVWWLNRSLKGIAGYSTGHGRVT